MRCVRACAGCRLRVQGEYVGYVVQGAKAGSESVHVDVHVDVLEKGNVTINKASGFSSGYHLNMTNTIV